MKTIKKKSTKYYKKKNIEKSTSKNTKKDLNFIEKKKIEQNRKKNIFYRKSKFDLQKNKLFKLGGEKDVNEFKNFYNKYLIIDTKFLNDNNELIFDKNFNSFIRKLSGALHPDLFSMKNINYIDKKNNEQDISSLIEKFKDITSSKNSDITEFINFLENNKEYYEIFDKFLFNRNYINLQINNFKKLNNILSNKIEYNFSGNDSTLKKNILISLYKEIFGEELENYLNNGETEELKNLLGEESLDYIFLTKNFIVNNLDFQKSKIHINFIMGSPIFNKFILDILKIGYNKALLKYDSTTQIYSIYDSINYTSERFTKAKELIKNGFTDFYKNDPQKEEQFKFLEKFYNSSYIFTSNIIYILNLYFNKDINIFKNYFYIKQDLLEISFGRASKGEFSNCFNKVSRFYPILVNFGSLIDKLEKTNYFDFVKKEINYYDKSMNESNYITNIKLGDNDGYIFKYFSSNTYIPTIMNFLESIISRFKIENIKKVLSKMNDYKIESVNVFLNIDNLNKFQKIYIEMLNNNRTKINEIYNENEKIQDLFKDSLSDLNNNDIINYLYLFFNYINNQLYYLNQKNQLPDVIDQNICINLLKNNLKWQNKNDENEANLNKGNICLFTLLYLNKCEYLSNYLVFIINYYFTKNFDTSKAKSQIEGGNNQTTNNTAQRNTTTEQPTGNTARQTNTKTTTQRSTTTEQPTGNTARQTNTKTTTQRKTTTGQTNTRIDSLNEYDNIRSLGELGILSILKISQNKFKDNLNKDIKELSSNLNNTSLSDNVNEIKEIIINKQSNYDTKINALKKILEKLDLEKLKDQDIDEQKRSILNVQQKYENKAYLKQIISSFYLMFNTIYKLRNDSIKNNNLKNIGYRKSIKNNKSIFNDIRFAQIMMGTNKNYPDEDTKKIYSNYKPISVSGGSKKNIYKKRIKKINKKKILK